MEEKDNLELLKENYEKVKKKYKLPTFEELDDEFEIRKIDYDSNLIKEIESNFFNEEDIHNMVIFYKKIWHLLHIGVNASLSSEADEAKFVNDMWLEWPKLKKKAKHFSDKLMESWAQAEKDDAPLNYTG